MDFAQLPDIWKFAGRADELLRPQRDLQLEPRVRLVQPVPEQLNALDPAHPVRVPCLTVLPLTGPAGPGPSF